MSLTKGHLEARRLVVLVGDKAAMGSEDRGGKQRPRQDLQDLCGSIPDFRVRARAPNETISYRRPNMTDDRQGIRVLTDI